MNNKFETLTAIAAAFNGFENRTAFFRVVRTSLVSENWHIQVNDNPECYIWFRTQKNRVEVSGSFHLVGAKGSSEYFGGDRGDGYCSISVSVDKSPEQIAKDILRRFLPGYLTSFSRCVEARDGQLAFNNQNLTTARRIVEAAGEVFTDDFRARFNQGGQEVSAYINRREENALRLAVRASGDTAEIDVGSLPADKAVRLVEFLKTLIAE